MSVAWIFPGQGSQHVGMGRALAERYPAAAGVYRAANEALGLDLARLCFEGPEDALLRTENAQPALLATSIAALRAAEEANGPLRRPAFVAGHSLGEFTALVAAGVLSFEEALRLVRRRGELMCAADPSGAMAAVLGLETAAIEAVLAASGVVVANDNAPGQTVVSGPKDALQKAGAALLAAGARRVIPLKVSAAFHSPAMRGVGDALAQEMARLRFADAQVPVVCNVDAEPRTNGADFPAVLARQAYSPVRWVATVRRMLGEGVLSWVELGAGTVLVGLIKRIVADASAVGVRDPKSLQEAASVLRQGTDREPR